MDTNQLNLFKKLLPGLLPIFVFILVDEFWSTEAGLVVAVVFGVGQLGYVFMREKRFDRFVFFDTLLLVALGGISIALNDEIFFKLKPALINLLFCAILGFSAFSSKNLLMIYTQRYMGDMKMPAGAEKAMQKTMKLLFWMMLAYTLYIVYSAFFMSKEAWAFISGGLLYVLFGLFFAWQFISAKLKAKSQGKTGKNEEWVPLVDEQGKILGRATRKEVHSGPGKLHPVVHLHIINSKGEIYLQKRPLHKDTQPGKWDTAVGGHVDLGESIEQALVRETAEELNITGLRPIPLLQHKWETEMESELVFSFTALYNANPVINKTELDDGRFWTIQEIRKNLGTGVFTPNFENELPILLKAMGRS
jgi:isopentenyldiphosphate isomerase/intracellular septation protein A